MRIQWRVPEYGWTTQKVFHFLNFVVNGGWLVGARLWILFVFLMFSMCIFDCGHWYGFRSQGCGVCLQERCAVYASRGEAALPYHHCVVGLLCRMLS